MHEICSKATIKTPEQRRLERRRSDIFIVNFKHISHPVLVFLLLTLLGSNHTSSEIFS